MSQQMEKMLAIVLIVFGCIFLWWGAKKLFLWFAISHYVPPPVTISASIATPKTWQSTVTSVGTLTAVNGVDISAEVPGIVKEIHFESGQSVKQGDVLVLLDTSIEEALLKDNQAQLKLAQLNYNRNKVLAIKSAVAQTELDKLNAQLQSAEAATEQTQAKIHQKTITAPFSGKIGIRKIDIGQFVSAGTAMVTLQSLDPLYVRFNLPEQYLSALYIQEPVKISLSLGNTTQTIDGTITAVDAKVDQATRNILVQATIPNKNLQLDRRI